MPRSYAVLHVTPGVGDTRFTTPPRGTIPDTSGTFMILSRMGKNTLALRGLVKKSARLFTVDTNGQRILYSSKSSRT